MFQVTQVGVVSPNPTGAIGCLLDAEGHGSLQTLDELVSLRSVDLSLLDSQLLGKGFVSGVGLRNELLCLALHRMNGGVSVQLFLDNQPQQCRGLLCKHPYHSKLLLRRVSMTENSRELVVLRRFSLIGIDFIF